MNMLLRFPEQGKEFQLTLDPDATQDDLSKYLLKSLGSPLDSFILLNPEGVSLKDKPLKSIKTDIIYAFLKDSIKKDKVSVEVSFNQVTTSPLPALIGDEKFLQTEKILHRMYVKALEYSDFFRSYSKFAEQINTEIEIIKSSKSVLSAYHQKYIQDQIENFYSLYAKNFSHFDSAKSEFANFDLSISALPSIKIHSALKNSNRDYLSDLIDISQLAKWKETYADDIKRLQQKFLEIEQTIKQLPFIYSLPEGDPVQFQITLVPEMITLGYQSMIDFYLEYRNLCEVYLATRDGNTGQRLHEENWEQNAGKKSNLVILDNALSQYKAYITDLTDKRKEANVQLFHLLRKITEFAARIRDSVKSQLSMLSSLLKRSEKRLTFIKVPRLLPEAHSSAIQEISRRNLFVKAASDIQKHLNLLIETEISERMAFLDKYRHVLPNNFVPQLGAGPFIKIVVGQNEPDLALPSICEPLPESFPHKDLYCKSIKTVNSEEKDKYENEIASLKEQVVALKSCLEFKSEELNISKEQNNLKIQDLSNELNLCKKTIMAKDAEKKEIETAFNETQAQLKVIQVKSKLENTETLKAAQEKLAFLQAENEKLKEGVNKLQNELRTKENLLLEAANTLKTVQDEFKTKDLQIKKLKEGGENKPGLAESISKDLGVRPEDLAEYIRKLKESDSSKISFTSFNEGSLALFFPTDGGHFLAFNYNCPVYYLNTDALSPQAIEVMHNEPYIVGLIIEKKKLVAENNNALSLPRGTEYFLLTIKNEIS